MAEMYTLCDDMRERLKPYAEVTNVPFKMAVELTFENFTNSQKSVRGFRYDLSVLMAEMYTLAGICVRDLSPMLRWALVLSDILKS